MARRQKANNGQCLNLVSFSASNYRAVVLNLVDRTLVHCRYLPNNVGTHLQLSVLRQIGVNEQKRTMPNVGDRTYDARVLSTTP